MDNIFRFIELLVGHEHEIDWHWAALLKPSLVDSKEVWIFKFFTSLYDS